MGLESGTWISDLVPTNPVGATDPKSQGDDHLRLMKSILQNTFPGGSKAFRFPKASNKSSNYTVLSTDDNVFFRVNATTGAVSITLPTSLTSALDGWKIVVQKVDDVNPVTIVGTINSGTDWVLSRLNESVTIYWTGTEFRAAAQNLPMPVTQKSANATLTSAEMYGLIDVQTNGGDVTITPRAAASKGEWVIIKKRNGLNSLTINPSGATTVDNETTFVMTQVNETVMIVFDGTANWYIAWHKIDIDIPDVIPPASHVSNLLIEPGSVPASRVNITCDEAVLIDGSGETIRHTAVSLTLNMGTSGANGVDSGSVANNQQYYIWLISNGTTIAAIAHAANITAPTMPSGYTFKKLVGWVRTGAGAALYQSRQKGSEFAYIVAAAGGHLPTTTIILDQGSAGTYSTTSPVLSSVAWSAYGPVEAALIRIGVTNYSGSASNLIVAPATTYGGTQNGPAGSNSMSHTVHMDGAFNLAVSIQLVPESGNIAWCSSGAGPRLYFHGFKVPWV